MHFAKFTRLNPLLTKVMKISKIYLINIVAESNILKPNHFLYLTLHSAANMYLFLFLIPVLYFIYLFIVFTYWVSEYGYMADLGLSQLIS